MKTSMKLSLVTCLFVLVACGSPDNIVIDQSGTDPNAGSGDDGSPNGTGPSSPSGKPDPSNPDTPPPPIVAGLSISKIAVFQGVEVDVLKGTSWVAQASRNAPLVAGRPALIRVYVTPDSSWSTSTKATAEIRLASGSTKFPIVSDTKAISGASTDDDPTSTFNLDVPGTSLPKDATFVVNITASGAKMPTGATPGRYPTDGTPKALGLGASGVLKVVVVPVKYMADGSGRLPDTGASQLDLYKKTMMARYPATDVQVTVRAPWSYSGSLGGGGSGISSLLNSATNLRQQDGAAPDVYYYVAFAPTSSFNSYCGGGCVTGLSSVVDDPSIDQLRVSVGIGYTGYESATTMAHEVGHAHGRNHAPCGGAAGVDPQFPYSSGGIGVWGYHMFDKQFIPPTDGKDMMGYCSPEWVSDYTFSALFDRVSAVNAMYGGATPGGTFQASQSYRLASVDAVGNVAWIGGVQTLDHEPRGGQIRAATFASSVGGTLARHDAHFYPFDHLPGGVLVVPVSSTPWTHVQFDGVSTRLAR
jgi:hypothetical protein